MQKKPGPGESFLRRPGPGEGLTGRVGPGESLVHQATDSDPDVEGHGLGDVVNQPIDGVTGAPTIGHDGLIPHPGNGE